MRTDGTDKRNTRHIGAIVLDLFFPWAGTALTTMAPAGRWGMIFWMSFLVAIVLWVLTSVIELPQAAVMVAVVWVVSQIWIQTRSIENARAGKDQISGADGAVRAGRYLSIALVVAVYVVTPVVFATRLAGTLGTVTVSDLGMFPTVLQDERLLVLKSRAGIDAGRLVVWNAPGGPAVGRVVAVAGEHVEVAEGLVTVNRKPSTVSRREAIEFVDIDLNARESLESAGMHYFLERHGSAGFETPAFLRPGVYTVSSTVDVPDGSVYVLSDNRTSAEATDSRHAGPISLRDVIGVPLFVLWSGGGGAFDRLERIGAWTR